MIGFIGCGKMARAIIAAILDGSSISQEEIIVYDTDKRALDTAIKDFGVRSAADNKGLVNQSEIVFLAVKPQSLAEVFSEIRGLVSSENLFVSIAGGVSNRELQHGLPKARIVRVMPNIACLAGETMACYSLSDTANANDKKFVEAIFSKAGKVLEIDEGKMHAVTALSGCGPGFIAFFVSELQKAGVAQGLSEEEAEVLAKQTLVGTAALVSKAGFSADEVVSMVASPKGITLAGLNSFEGNDFSEIVKKAVGAAIKRSMELGA